MSNYSEQFINPYNQNESKNISSKLYSSENGKSEEIEDNKELNILFCDNCSKIYKIKFKNINAIKSSCYCTFLENLPLKDYFEQVKNSKININNINCNTHKKPFEYHCYDCGNDLCEECLILNFAHKGHTILLYCDNNISKKGNEKEICENTIKKIKENNEKYKKDNNPLYFITDKNFLQILENSLQQINDKIIEEQNKNKNLIRIDLNRKFEMFKESLLFLNKLQISIHIEVYQNLQNC